MARRSLTREAVVRNPQGLHARPADLFARLACQFSSKIEIIKGNERVEATSILNLLTLGAEQGTQLTIVATGDDAEEALNQLADFLENYTTDEDAHP